MVKLNQDLTMMFVITKDVGNFIMNLTLPGMISGQKSSSVTLNFKTIKINLASDRVNHS